MADPFSSDPPPLIPPSPETEICAVSGLRYPRREMIQYEGQWIAAVNKDAFFQRLREGVAAVPGARYAGFWIRFLAKFIDGMLLGVVGFVINLALAFAIMGHAFISRPNPQDPQAALRGMYLYIGVTFLVGLALKLVYDCFFIRRYDATVGKMALGLKLLRPDGAKLSIGRIIGRRFAEMVSLLILWFGYMMAGWDDEKRALHDRICDTRVVYAR